MPQKLHCARCGRVTLHPAVVIGALPFGRASEARRDARTMDLFGGAL